MTQSWTRRRLVVLTAAGITAGWGGALAQEAQERSTGPATPAASPVATPRATPAATPQTESDFPHEIASVGSSVTIALTDQGFRPDFVQTTNGTDLRITLVNQGSRTHGFQIEQLDVDVTLAPGERKTVTITSPPLGTFTYTSNAPGDEEMYGTLVFYI